jgi:cell division protein FtsW (lipid II flippase)
VWDFAELFRVLLAATAAAAAAAAVVILSAPDTGMAVVLVLPGPEGR